MRLASTRLFLALALILCLLLPAWALSAPSTAAPPPTDAAKIPAGVEYVPGEILVRFRASASAAALNKLLKAEQLQPVREVKRLGVRVLRLPEGLSVEEAMKRLSGLPEVEYVEPNLILRTCELSKDLTSLGITDPGLSNQWSPQKMDAPAAWQINAGDPGVVIAIVDTGVDYLHSELAPNLWTNPNEIPGNGIDDDGNGYVDDIHGWDLQNNDAQPLDDHFHGTHVAGIAAAAPSDNPAGLVGICPNCRILPVKVLDSQGSGSLDRVASGIVYAAESGARVINMSLGGTAGSPTLENAVNTAWSMGSLVVAAAGNNGAELRFYPAAYANAMAVASTNQDDWRSCFSNYYQGFISVAAPGEYIYSTTPRDASGNDTYGTYSGTSMATPHASGLAGLLFSQNPARTNREVRLLMESSAIDLGPAGDDAFFGYGRINAARALGGTSSPTTPPAGLFADVLTATGPANARKLVRDDAGLLHWVWVGEGQVRYATSADGQSWSQPAALGQGSDPALESDGVALYLAYASAEGSTYSRILFMKKSGGWSQPVLALGGDFQAARPALYRDPGNGKLYLAAASQADTTAIYYTSSADGGQSWSPAQTITVGAAAGERSRLAAVYANGDSVLLLARTAEPVFFGLMYSFRLYAFTSTDGGGSWSARQELGSASGGLDDEPGVSIAGVGGRIYIAYGQGGKVNFRSLQDFGSFSAAYALGSGDQPSITQLADGQAWVIWEKDGGLWWRHYTGSGWDSAEAILSATSRNKSYYPNFKLGASGEVVEWVTTHCSGAPFLVTYNQKALAEMPVSYPVRLSAAAYTVNEGVGSATITVVMSQATTRVVSVDYAAADGAAPNGAVAGGDYTATKGTLTFAPGETVKTFAVPIKDDGTDELDETLLIALSNISNALPGDPLSAVVTIVDNDAPPSVSFGSSTSYANESAGAAAISVKLSAASGFPVMVGYATVDGTAASGADYVPASGVLAFAPGETSKTFSVTILDDTLPEADETVKLSLNNPSNATLGAKAAATLSIDDNDTIKFSISNYLAKENVGAATITVKLNAASALAVSVDYATSDETALAGVDYAATNGTLTFLPGETSKTLEVTILDDILAEADETIKLTLFNPVNAGLGSPNVATLKIDDNDTIKFSVSSYTVNESAGAATITVKLSAASSLPVSVDYATSDETALAGVDYAATNGTLTFTPGETSKTFEVTILDDILAEADETIKLTLSNPVNAGLGSPNVATLKIDDNDTIKFSLSNYTLNESAGAATITVKLNAASGLPVSVNYATSNGTALAGVDYVAASGALTFLPGETSKTFLVTVMDDILAEADETVKLTLSNPVNGGLASPPTANLTIDDNDTLKFSLSTYTVKENVGEATVTVRLSAASTVPVSVDYATSDETALAGVDYAATNGMLTFLPGETSKTFTVTILDDILAEANETVKLTLSNPVNAGLGSPSTANLSITDNDTLKFSLSNYSVKENLGPATVTVRLSAASDLEVRVDYATADGTALAGADYTPASGTLIFAPGETSKTFTVTLLDDAIKEPNETVKLALSNPANAGLGSPSAATVTIQNDD
jgi:subtilisin family serine protease